MRLLKMKFDIVFSRFDLFCSFMFLGCELLATLASTRRTVVGLVLYRHYLVPTAVATAHSDRGIAAFWATKSHRAVEFTRDVQCV